MELNQKNDIDTLVNLYITKGKMSPKFIMFESEYLKKYKTYPSEQEIKDSEKRIKSKA